MYVYNKLVSFNSNNTRTKKKCKYNSIYTVIVNFRIVKNTFKIYLKHEFHSFFFKFVPRKYFQLYYSLVDSCFHFLYRYHRNFKTTIYI